MLNFNLGSNLHLKVAINIRNSNWKITFTDTTWVYIGKTCGVTLFCLKIFNNYIKINNKICSDKMVIV